MSLLDFDFFENMPDQEQEQEQEQVETPVVPFSVCKLETDVSDYIEYRRKYHFYRDKKKTKLYLFRKRHYVKRERYYHLLYLKKMKYLEDTYNKMLVPLVPLAPQKTHISQEETNINALREQLFFSK